MKFFKRKKPLGKSKNSVHMAPILLGAVTCSLFSLLVLRMADLQLLHGASYRAQANANRIFTVTIPAERGVFTDVFNEPLVYNSRRYYSLENSAKVYSDRVRITREDALQRMASDAGSVTYDVERTYRYPEATAHVLGYTGPVSATDLTADRTLKLSDSIGKMGLEAVLNDKLRGESGRQEYEINALGNVQRLVSTQPGRPGQSVSTSIDPFLSQIAYDALEENQGAVVILDGDTGGVLSMVSKPSFNASVMSSTEVGEEDERARRQKVAEYISHPQKLFFNRAISGAYPPGSVFKIVTALAGLETGAVTATTTVRDEGILEVGEYSYANWYYTQYGRTEGDVALQRALARSNDIYFY
ncbi:MAG: penicillin-binding transpeptidase domain-containing protein, partial [Microgenomates group bacterium]